MPSVQPGPDVPSSPVRALLRDLGAFGAVGGFALAVDVGVFHLLYLAGTDPVGAKLGSTLVGTTTAYLGHRYWSFAHRVRNRIRRTFFLFGIVNATTLVIGLAIVWFVRHPLEQQSVVVLQAANLASIGIGSVIRFLTYRRWVFPAPSGAVRTSAAGRSATEQEPGIVDAPSQEIRPPSGSRSGR